jgi:PHD/YefM family antitoxin component YafN of YafNO toxin-antitoxin module
MITMEMTTISSRHFNQDVSRAKQAAAAGPVIITNRGRPSHVLLNFRDYENITAKQSGVADLLSMPATDEILFDPPKITNLYQPATF